MFILENIKVAFSSLMANKMRSLLTMLGIIIGIASVITIVALGQGSQATISNEFKKFGTNRVAIYMNWRENPPYRERFDDGDIEAIRRAFGDELEAISPRYSISATAKKGRYSEAINLFGINHEFNRIDNFNIINGRFLLKQDVLSKRNVAVIDKKLALELFKRVDVIGEKIMVDTNFSKMAFTVVGVYEKPESSLGKISGQLEGTRTDLYIPIKTLQKMGVNQRYYLIEANIADGRSIEGTTRAIINRLERKNKNEGKNYYIFQTAQQQMEIADNVLGVISKVISAIAAISLLVGGIGVMNIMLVSVTERTREIGIRKAIGARKKDIMIQFLIEAMIISGTGGLIGAFIGLSIASAIAFFLGVPPKITLLPVFIAIIFSAGVGIFFGIYPARKASKLDPIDALRYE